MAIRLVEKNPWNFEFRMTGPQSKCNYVVKVGGGRRAVRISTERQERLLRVNALGDRFATSRSVANTITGQGSL